MTEKQDNELTHNRFNQVITHFSKSIGVSSVVAANLVSQAIAGCTPNINTPNEEWEFISSLLCSFNPHSIQEAMLAIQMVAMHFQTTQLLRKSVGSGFSIGMEQYLSLAIKTSKLYAKQMETMKKIQSKGEQRMIVEHVNVHSGGQAIVGHVQTRGVTGE